MWQADLEAEKNMDASRKKVLGKVLLSFFTPLNQGRHLHVHQGAFPRYLEHFPRELLATEQQNPAGSESQIPPY